MAEGAVLVSAWASRTAPVSWIRFESPRRADRQVLRAPTTSTSWRVAPECCTQALQMTSRGAWTSTNGAATRVHQQVPRHPPRLLRGVCRHSRRHCPREGDQGLEAISEDQSDRRT